MTIKTRQRPHIKRSKKKDRVYFNFNLTAEEEYNDMKEILERAKDRVHTLARQAYLLAHMPEQDDGATTKKAANRALSELENHLMDKFTPLEEDG